MDEDMKQIRFTIPGQPFGKQRPKGFQIMSGLDVIEYTLKAGEKDRIIDAIDTLSGYESNIEEVAKN